MKYDELFELESFLVNSCLRIDQFNVKGTVPLRNLIGETKYGIWDTYQAKGMWIIVTIEQPSDANRMFQTLLERFPKLPLENAIMIIQNQNCEYKIAIQVNETEL